MANASQAIARLRELRAKATAGEWRQKHHLESDLADAIVTEKDERGYWSFIARTHSAYGRAHVPKSQWEANAAAIVAAMNSLPALLECAEALEALHQRYELYAGGPDAPHAGETDKTLLKICRNALQALAGGGE